MRVSTTGRGRLLPLLLFFLVLAVAGIVLAGVALGATVTTLSPSTSLPAGVAQTESFEVRAADLGGLDQSAPKITSPSAIVESMATGKVLYERNADAHRLVGSTAKIMTAMLVLESLPLDQEVKVPAAAGRTGGSALGLPVGQTFTVEQLLYAMLVPSANDAAITLAVADAGSVSAFVALMNQKAHDLGMVDTHFATPNGLDAPGQYSTAADMALLGRYAMKNEEFRKLVGTKSYSLSLHSNSQPTTLTNTNKLLLEYDWITGIKTGLTPGADHCLVASGTKNGLSVISVLLGQSDDDLRFSESRALLEYGLTQFRDLKLVDKGVAVAEANVPYQMDGKVELVTDGAVETELYKDDVVTTSVNVERPLELPITAGETYGHVVVSSGGKEVGRVAIVATKSFAAPTLGSKLAYYWHRLGAALGIG